MKSNVNEKGTEVVEVDLEDGNEKPTLFERNGKPRVDDELAEEDDQESQLLSDSVQEDDVSTVDLAEEREKQVRKTLLSAILSAIGVIFCMQMIGKIRSMGKWRSCSYATSSHVMPFEARKKLSRTTARRWKFRTNRSSRFEV